MALWVVWFSVTLWHVLFVGLIFAAILVVGGESTLRISARAGWISWLAGLVMILLIPVGYFGRNQVYKSHWQADAVTPEGYLSGNIMLIMCITFSGLGAFMGLMISEQPLPFGVPLLANLFILMVNYPSARPMDAEAVRLGKSVEARQ
ncbi:MAG: hypothetical protein AAF911_08335 [Planctomycetota bacterium]